MSSSAADIGLWVTIADEAGRESPLWGAALRPGERDETPVFSPLADGRFALGLESIYEGYLLHYGRPRLFAPADSDTAILLGDYLYAHGLVRVAAQGDVTSSPTWRSSISLCAQLRADGRGRRRRRLGGNGDDARIRRRAPRGSQGDAAPGP